MNTQLHNNKKPEVYSISGFRDTLASPIFYPVIVVSITLGIASIFGFVQNPLKLKSIVSVIQQKVSDINVVSDSFESQRYVFANPEAFKVQTKREQTAHPFPLFTDINETSALTPKIKIEGDFERIAFNYDVTSESFWTDLDSSSLESVTEEMERKNREATTFGAPLRIDHHESLPSDFNLKDDSIYAINSYHKI